MDAELAPDLERSVDSASTSDCGPAPIAGLHSSIHLQAARIRMETAMPVAGLLRDPSAPGDATPRCASRMRRLLGGLSLLALLAASPARAATDPPVPSTPADALALLRWC